MAPVGPVEANGIAAPCPLVVGGKLHLLYQSYGNGVRDAILHAVSDDGIHFERDPSNPVFSPKAPWCSGRAIDAEAVMFRDKIYMAFATRDPSGKTQMIGMASAEASSRLARGDWTELSTEGPVIRPELPWEKSCIEAPSLCVRDGKLHMFYAGGYNNEPQQIGCASSTDGLRWTRLYKTPLLPNGRPGTWNSAESGHPFIFVDSDGSSRLFFQGNDNPGATWSISSMPVEWTAAGPRLQAAGAPAQQRPLLLLDMVHNNPGEPTIRTKWNSPDYIKNLGYSGQVPKLFVQCAIDYASFDPSLCPAGSPQRTWIDAEARKIDSLLKDARQAKVPLYPFTDFMVVPQSLMKKYGAEMCTDGQLDARRPRTQEVLRSMVDGIFTRFPDLEGLTLRFGETYLHDTPFHQGGRPMASGGDAAIAGHIALIRLLREELCVKRNRTLIYRTWDFGFFHDQPKAYLAITDAIEPHPKLLFSIKHQQGDFHRMSVLNTNIATGKHRQIIEVQSQREAYGKGAHPFYIGQGVIHGWEEYSWLMKDKRPRGLAELAGNPLLAGIWTWSLGGGWEGPRMGNELWCDLNTWVMAAFTQDPTRTEPEIFSEVCSQKLGLSAADTAKLRELCLLSASAVLRGQLSTHGQVPVWWCRDEYLETPNLTPLLDAGLGERLVAEKDRAVNDWKRIEQLSREITFRDPANTSFARVSSSYGRIKYAIIAEAWRMMVLNDGWNRTGKVDRQAFASALARYDDLWKEWLQLKADHADCPTLHQPKASPHSNRPHLQDSVQAWRSRLQQETAH
jgi:hypothetical protein